MTIYTRPTTLPAWAESGDKVQPSSAEIQTGWPAASNTPPSRQRFNWIQHWLANGLRYFMQMGIPEWSADESYPINARVQYDGEVYRAVAENSNIAPGTDASKWLVGASATGVTPAQFDNDTSLATTAFVQRALGNRNGFYSYAVSTQLTAQHAGATVSSSSSSAISLNLPQIGSVVSGAVVEIINSGTGLLTVWPTPADLLYVFGQSGTVPALNMEPGASMKFLSTGAGWVGFGSGQLKFDPDFKSSLSPNGYQKLPSGLIIQWGNAGNIASASSVAVTYPIAFPNGALSASATVNTATNTATPQGAGITYTSASQLTIRNLSAITLGFTWIAIGY